LLKIEDILSFQHANVFVKYYNVVVHGCNPNLFYCTLSLHTFVEVKCAFRN